MLVLSILSLGASFYLYARTEKALVKEVQEDVNELSSAISVSVEELTSTEHTREGKLQDYVKRLEKSGVKEINIVSNEKEVIASSNPKRVGSKIDPKRKDILFTAKLGEQVSSPTRKAYDILVPIVVEGEQQGYAHISMVFDDYEKLIQSHYLGRLFTTLLVFSIGIIVSIFLSRRYTKPIYQIMGAARKVASGDLSQTIPTRQGDDEINDLTRSFNEMIVKLRQNKVLEERLRETEHLTALGQLASGIAHEIRNPLNFISLSIDHLREKAGQIDPAERQRTLDLIASIKSETHRLNQMVENFLRYGRPMKLQIRPLQLDILIREVVLLANQKAVEQGIVLDYLSGPLPTIEGDEEKIKTCLVNIVANGIQAMPKGGTLTVRVKTFPEEVEIEIRDTGQGIAQEDLKRVFQPYFTTKQLGIGLGLALTKRVVEEHHGAIRIDSRPGDGTIVTLSLPVRQPVLDPEILMKETGKGIS